MGKFFTGAKFHSKYSGTNQKLDSGKAWNVHYLDSLIVSGNNGRVLIGLGKDLFPETPAETWGGREQGEVQLLPRISCCNDATPNRVSSKLLHVPPHPTE